MKNEHSFTLDGKGEAVAPRSDPGLVEVSILGLETLQVILNGQPRL